MSDMIRQLMGQRRGPVGMGNNPSPFPIPTPDYDMIEQPAGPEQPGGDSRAMLLQSMMDQGDAMDRYRENSRDLQDYYRKERDPRAQQRMRQELEEAARAPNPFIGKGRKIQQGLL